MAFKFEGTVLLIGDDEATAILPIGCLTGFNYTENEPTSIDATCADTTEFKEFLVGLKDASSVEVDLNLDNEDAGFLEAWDAKEAGTEKTFIINYADAAATSETFQGVVQTISKAGAIDDKWTSTMSIKVVGKLIPATPPAP